MTEGDRQPGLAWPDHDTGPKPPPEYGDSRDDRPRKRLTLWDRTKYLFGGGLLFGLLFAGEISKIRSGEFPPERLEAMLGVDPVRAQELAETLRTVSLGTQAELAWELALDLHRWVLVLLAFELVRQLHNLIAERWTAYHRFFSERLPATAGRGTSHMSDWSRYRVARTLKWLVFLVFLDLLVASVFDFPVATALIEFPAVLATGVGNALRHLPTLGVLFFVLIVQFVGAFWFLSRVGREIYMPEDVKTRFSDVWGQDRVLDRVKENIIFLEDPESIEAKGGHVPSGILLWGPPGTGKTLMAEAVAGETGKPFVYADVGAMNGYFMGMGVLAVKGLFRKLRKLAVQHGGVVVFLDEADALGSRGAQVARRNPAPASPWTRDCNGLAYQSEEAVSTVFSLDQQAVEPERPPRIRDRFFLAGGGGGGGGALQALLTELSGLRKPRGFFNKHVRRALGMRPKPPPRYRLLVMMATNMPDVLDPALLRPGRIDRQYKVGYPSKAGRVRTYEGYLAKVKHSLTSDDIDRLATITPYATGATIKDLVNEALINALGEGREVIEWPDIIRARLLKALGPPEDVEYIERERHATAIHEACHAVTAYRVRYHATIDVATIEKGQSYLGMVSSIPLEEQFTNWKSEYEADLMVGLAALVGERIFFDGDQSSGVSGDLHNATTLSMVMEGYWGMGSTLSSHSASKAKVQNVRMALEDGTDRNMLETDLGRRVEGRLQEIMERTRTVIQQNRHHILALAHALEVHRTITGEDVEAVMEGTVGPLVDGGPYHTREFIQAAEEYHAKVLQAHKAHGHVEVPLPSLEGLPAQVGAGSWSSGSPDDGGWGAERSAGDVGRPDGGGDGGDPGGRRPGR